MEEKNYVMNDEGEFGKYVVQTLRTPKFSPEFQEIYKQWGRRLLWIDGNTVPGAFQMNMTWYVKRPILHFSISMNPEYSYTPTKKEDE